MSCACGCCEPGRAPTPAPIDNAPGAPSLRFRVGTYGAFRRAMLLDAPLEPMLAAWTTRDDDDHGMVLLDLWAYVADVLAFYQERLANEGYLRTAILPASVRRLAGLLGYRPAPGLSAVVDLALLAEPGRVAQAPAGLRVQHVPVDKEEPQKFETDAPLEVRAQLNRVVVDGVPIPYAALAAGSAEAVLRGVVPAELTAGLDLVVFDERHVERKAVASVTEHRGVPVLAWEPPIQTAMTTFTARVSRAGTTRRLFGADSPTTWVVLVPGATLTTDPTKTEPPKVETKTVSGAYDFRQATTDEPRHAALDAIVDDLRPGTSLLLVQAGASAAAPRGFARMARVTGVRTGPASIANIPTSQTVTWATLGFAVIGRPAVVADATGSSGRLQVFAVGDDGAIWHVAQSGASQATWTAWESLGGRATAVAACRRADGAVVVVARAEDGALWSARRISSTAGVTAWTPVGVTGTEPAIMPMPEGGVLVMAIAPGGAVVHATQAAGSDTWGAPGSLGGWADRLALAARSDGRAALFVRGSDQAVYHRRQISAAAWSGWAGLGGTVDLLAAGRNAENRLEVLGRGTNQQAFRKAEVTPGGAWSSWSSLGGIVDRLDVGRRSDGRLVALGRGTDERIYVQTQSTSGGAWPGTWQPLATPTVEDFAVGANGDGRLEIAAGGPTGKLLHVWEVAPSGSWSTGFGDRGLPMWTVEDRRQLDVVELAGDPLDLAAVRPPDTVTGARVLLRGVLDDAPEPGRRLLLDDAGGEPVSATVEATETIDADGDGVDDHVAVDLASPLARALASDSAFALGNVVGASHGVSRAEVLGSALAALDFQSFALAKQPVTHLPRAGAEHGAASTLDVRVTGQRWDVVPHLLGHDPDERVVTTSTDDDGATRVRFGDGRTGARPPTGRDNVTATYRVGLGRGGNVPAETLTNVLTKPRGLKGALNPSPAGGGADPEPPELVREGAPAGVRTFGRVVSLRDFADAAREHAAVAKSAAATGWDGRQQVVAVTVAGDGGAVLDAATLGAVRADLDARRDPNRAMRLDPHGPVGIRVDLEVGAAGDRLPVEVAAAVRAALLAAFAFDARDLGAGIAASDVYAIVHGVSGVAFAHLRTLRFAQSSRNPTSEAVQERLRIAPGELLVLAESDLVVEPA